MYFSEYDFDVEYEDFQEAEYDFVCGSLSYHAGDLVFGDFEDGTVFVLKKLPNWDVKKGYSFFIWDRTLGITGLHDCAESFEEAWGIMCEWLPQHCHSMYECTNCGWKGYANEMESEELQEDYGDVSTWKCPSCGCIDYDEELFEIVE